MEEKIIIKSEHHGVNIPAFLFLIVAVLLFAIGSAIGGSPIDFLEGFFEDYIVFFILILVCIIGAIISFIWISNCKLVITDKRIYGKAAFGRSINLPVDMISAVSTGMFNSFSVSTSSGRITFYLLKNCEDLNTASTKLILNRQEQKKAKESTVSNADELKKYKDLLDSGIITQEEFDAKKKELLDL